jgi:hypothetical protein
MRFVEFLIVPGSLVVIGALSALVACSPAPIASLDDSDAGDQSGDGLNLEDPSGDDPMPTTPVPTTNVAPQTDAGTAPVVTDAAVPDAAPPPPPTLLPFGSTCTVSSGCADGLCLPFKDHGLRCTKICSSNSDCPSNSCGDSPRICDL